MEKIRVHTEVVLPKLPNVLQIRNSDWHFKIHPPVTSFRFFHWCFQKSHPFSKTHRTFRGFATVPRSQKKMFGPYQFQCCWLGCDIGGAKEPGVIYFPTNWGAKEPQNVQNQRVVEMTDCTIYRFFWWRSYIWSNCSDLTRLHPNFGSVLEGKSQEFQKNLGWWNIILLSQWLTF